MGIITSLEVQKRNKERVNVYLDNEYAFSLTLIEAAKLHKGQTLTESEIEVLCAADDVNRAVDSAVRFLAHRPRSVAEVRRNLQKKQFHEDAVEASIERLKQMGYLDDTAFAHYWLENRNTFKPRGRTALRYELRQKGVAANVIDSVLESVDEPDLAYRAALKKASRLHGLDRRTFQQKIGSFLQQRGFSYSVSRDVIEQLANEMVEDDPKFFVIEE